ncbi:probable protein kinase DDB_G0277539 [Melitaea cinxia]|uniref:probable protein kinase DDB_G0277539 n=1 Tax=Melitaea cinxia TaxID=113334 RepID=UPI001E26F14D|nr:probable protein kinase DDB_G0277539 [Melitaea cinxia]
MWCFLLLTLFATVQGRAVNISNTWVLPEEGFPVFYRYFRDRISWYEADAVCQFHHANLVTVDTTAQYDAVRAYLKELDISSAVWIGLIRSNPDGDFTWTDYRGLSSDGYWSAAPDARSAPLCAAADPAGDYRWEARACGGPSVASFICELPVPQWALGNEGCMVRALPALTILYLPESAAVQLTADCGLAGVKRVQCTGNMKREDLLKELSCSEDEQTSTTSVLTSSVIPSETSTDLGFSNQDVNKEISTEESFTTEHEDDINQYSTELSSKIPVQTSTMDTWEQKHHIPVDKYRVSSEKNDKLDITENNNLLSNDIPKEASNNEFFINEESEKLEDERNMQHKKLHDELARLGNFETIFNQPTDHFVPPLVMAKAKISDDMTALSIEEKLAQQLAERQSIERNNIQSTVLDTKNDFKDVASTETLNKIFITDNPLTNILSSTGVNNNISNTKNVLPKKYNNKYDNVKTKNFKARIYGKSIDLSSPPSNSNTEAISTNPLLKTLQLKYPSNKYPEEDSSLELTVIIKEPDVNNKHKQSSKNFTKNDTNNLIANKTENKLTYTVTTDRQVILNDEVIKIEIINERNNSRSNIDVTVYEVTTKTPAYKDDSDTNNSETTVLSDHHTTTQPNALLFTISDNPPSSVNDLITASIRPVEQNLTSSDTVPHSTEATLITVTNDLNIDTNAYNFTNDMKTQNISEDAYNTYNVTINESHDGEAEADFNEHVEKNNTDTTPEIDDFQSPLLSAASEPLHKPNRSRRPQQNRVNKFNPFRILG